MFKCSVFRVRSSNAEPWNARCRTEHWTPKKYAQIAKNLSLSRYNRQLRVDTTLVPRITISWTDFRDFLQNSRLFWSAMRHGLFSQDDIYRGQRRWSELWGFKRPFLPSELYILPWVLGVNPQSSDHCGIKWNSFWDIVLREQPMPHFLLDSRIYDTSH